MRKMVFLPIAALLAASPVAAQVTSAALTEYMINRGKAVVAIRGIKTLPNGLSAPLAGTGFVISADGYVLTAGHVVDGISRETLGVSHSAEMNPKATFTYEGSLEFADAPSLPMKLVRLDDLRDLALLKFVNPGPYGFLELASGKGQVAPDQILALGFPAASAAIVPAMGRITDTTRSDKRWLIDAPVNPGHSGGPVIRRDGRVIGVVHAGIQGVTLMNLMIQLNENDALLKDVGITQNARAWPPASGAMPARTRYDDIQREGSCEDRRGVFEDAATSVNWKCTDKSVPRGVAEHVERTRTVRLVVPASAEILDVRYFHRSRGDWQNPVEQGPWHTNPPNVDLQWMQIDLAEVVSSGDQQIVEAECHNWSHEMEMYCGIGVQFKSGAWLW